MRSPVAAMLLATALAVGGQIRDRDEPNPRVFERTFELAAPSEVVATVHAGCSRCSWGAMGREAVALRLAVDSRYSQHVLLARGKGLADYAVTLGALDPGRHRLTVELDSTLSAAHAFPPTVTGVELRIVDRAEAAYLAQSMAPILHARPNTIGKFTDLPILMWYEVQPTAGGWQLRYSVIFTNEDGGTATDRLMATWGRTTDIEFVYGVEIDAAGAVVSEQFQGAGHHVPTFKGRHEAKHPLLWIATDNNMVSDTGSTAIRYAPAPERFDLTDVSREAVMDAHPWSYTLAAEEMAREGKIENGAPPGSGKIPDPRRFVFVEACSELEDAALAFSVRVKNTSGAVRWYDSDRGLPDFRIVRTGCFRGAVPLPADSGRPDAIRFRAFPRPARAGAPASAAVTLRRINKVFMLGSDYTPGASLFTWTGSLTLPSDGDWRELSF